MISVTINRQNYQVEEGITIMEAARRNGIDIPSLCYIKDVHKLGACRICVVEVEGAKNLMASCMTTIKDGMVINTYSNRVNHARKLMYELMLSDHSEDCLSCARNQSCEFQALGKQLGVDSSRFAGERSNYHTDASVAIERDMSKCIHCRRCVTACGVIQKASVLNAQNRGFDTEISPAMGLKLGESNCTYCGQCTLVCPVGALHETSAKRKVWNALEDRDKYAVVQVAPAVRAALGEEFGMRPGTRVTGKLAAALRKLGFRAVFDTNFAADLTIIEEGTELLERLSDEEGAALPMITSCSPGWIKYTEHHYPGLTAHLSTCKSPHTMLGAVIKSYYARQIDRKGEEMFVVSVMPCTAKKFEIAREEMKNDGLQNVDQVLTTRELADMIRSAGIQFENLEDEGFDDPLGLSSGAADIFGFSGGVMEAALRTVVEKVTGHKFDGPLATRDAPDMPLVREAAVEIAETLPEFARFKGVTLRCAVTSGLSGAEMIMEQLARGESPYHFIEVMGCPGGCVMGGGQPRGEREEVFERRMDALRQEDEGKAMRRSHENPNVLRLYEDFLSSPGGYLAHDLLHTHYVKRGLFQEIGGRSYAIEGKKVKQPAKRAAPMARQSDAKGDHESPRILELEVENKRIKGELKDAQESIEILKSVLSDYN